MFFFDESVLLPAYRGRGLGRPCFFDHREAHARGLGRKIDHVRDRFARGTSVCRGNAEFCSVALNDRHEQISYPERSDRQAGADARCGEHVAGIVKSQHYARCGDAGREGD